MRWHRQYWVGILLIVLNLDLIIPFFKLLKFSWLTIFFIIWPIAVSELCLWWWFWERFKKKIFPEILEITKERLANTDKGKEGISIWKNIRVQLEKEGLWPYFKIWVTNYFKELYETAIDQDNEIVNRVKKWGHAGIFIIGASPIPAARTSLAIFCAITRWRSGFCTLLISDILHVAIVIFSWEIFFSILRKIN